MNKRLFFVTVLFLIVPVSFWFCGWHWQGKEISSSYYFFLLTQTAGKPWFIVSCFILFTLLYFAHRRGEIQLLALLILFSIGSTQVLKTVIKPLVAEPRPYVVAMFANNNTNIRAFYAQPRVLRAAIVSTYYEERGDTPSYLSKHRAHETGYSFPSGHTIFAVSWSFLFAGVIGFANRRRALISGAVIFWAVNVMFSRVLLGMHYPVDLAAAIIISAVIHLLLLAVWQRRNTPQIQKYIRRLSSLRRSNKQ
ncbi:MAG: phosphatase PAP2 family protein [Cardiobacteriaceae bacterium]|nr:phosphatase PAP2 family protein [Cardiobacteriaceae bacterium]